MSPEVADLRVLRCDSCGGEMRCERVTRFVYGRVDMGREYVFRCAGCRSTLLDMDPGRWRVYAIRFAFLVPILLAMVAFATHVVVGVARRGFGGNDPSAIYLLVGVLYALGVGGLIGLGLRGRYLLRERARNRVIRPV